MQFYDFKEIEERVILIGVQTGEDEDVAASLDELEERARTDLGMVANGETFYQVVEPAKGQPASTEAAPAAPVQSR